MTDFKPIVIKLVGKNQVDRVRSIVENIPVGQEIECVFRKEQKVRGLDANARMWAGPLKDIENQAWICGRQHSAEVWHEYFKEQYLPEENDENLHLMVKNPEKYKKWDFDPRGKRILVGSTTDLLKYGFAIYMQQIEAEGAQMGVMFHEAPQRIAA